MPSPDLTTLEDLRQGRARICIVGLGYVGLPLAVLLARKFSVTGFDINPRRIEQLQSGYDLTGEVTREALLASGVTLSSDPKVIAECRVVIVTVPTPIDHNKLPDLRPLKSATRTVGENLSAGSVVVYESTVYPGMTEEECVVIIEEAGGLTYQRDFFVGYSPERVNPGDKERTIDKIVKVVSGDTPQVLELLAGMYGEVITAGIHRASSIKVAEAAKVIENTQRDLNIALMNELAMIFHRMGIDTTEVLRAAYTKWNFVRFEPGLVGGHCIGVDPYYLTFKAQSLGFIPEIILAGRRINDGMGGYVASTTVKKLIRCGRTVRDAHVLLLGLTFKENVPDIRNTRVVDIIAELQDFGIRVSVHDPHASADDARHEYGIELLEDPAAAAPYDAVIVAVRHRAIIEKYTPEDLRRLCPCDAPVMMDIKAAYEQETARAAGFEYWRL